MSFIIFAMTNFDIGFDIIFIRSLLLQKLVGLLILILRLNFILLDWVHKLI